MRAIIFVLGLSLISCTESYPKKLSEGFYLMDTTWEGKQHIHFCRIDTAKTNYDEVFDFVTENSSPLDRYFVTSVFFPEFDYNDDIYSYTEKYFEKDFFVTIDGEVIVQDTK